VYRAPKNFEDNGSGFLMAFGGAKVGLTNMTDRIGAVGGSLAVRSSPRAGTQVEGRIPLASAVLVPSVPVAELVL